jgi:hypothetical protein
MPIAFHLPSALRSSLPYSLTSARSGTSRLALLSLCAAAGAAVAAPGTGNPNGGCTVPVAGRAVSITNPTHVIGNGTKASCTSEAVVRAVAAGGVITFNCGPDPVTIVMKQTAKVFNDRPNVTIDGGGKVTLSGDGVRRILYQNTCDEAQHWTTPYCGTQELPKLTVQNITFTRGDSEGQTYGQPEVLGGGAIYVRGGQFKVVNSRFFRNTCDATGPDVGGAAVRVFGNSPVAPVYITNSTFGGGENYANRCSNGGAISGLHASFTITNTLITYNDAIGYGANPAEPGTPGGGSGGAIYQDGNTIDLTMCGNKIAHNHANEGGGASFFVSNNLTGTMSITDSSLIDNPSDKFETRGLPGIFVLARPGQPVITNSILRD